MTWFRVDDKLHDHVKSMRAGHEAMGLWVLAASWSAGNLTDGWVPNYAAQRLAPNAPELAERLVRAGLWHVDTVDGEDGWRFHTWSDWQRTREQVEAEREAGRERMRKIRAGGVRANNSRTAPVRAAEVRDSDTDTDTDNTTTRKREDAAAADAAAETFQAWWAKYPRKVGKTAAAKAYTRALKRADADTLQAGLTAAVAGWTACGTEPRFIPHASTWLNEGRWEDQEQLPVTQQGVTKASGPTRTAAQCGNGEPHSRHPWEDGSNAFMCLGVVA